MSLYRVDGSYGFKFLKPQKNFLSGALERLSSKNLPNSPVKSDFKLNANALILRQAFDNANDAQALLKIADGALSEQKKLLERIHTKATAAAQDGLSQRTRNALHAELSKLLSAYDEIAHNTMYGQLPLLNGAFANKSFQVGLNPNTDFKISIMPTQSLKLGTSHFVTSHKIVMPLENFDVSIKSAFDRQTYTLRNQSLGKEEDNSIKVLSDRINAISDKTGLKSYFKVEYKAQRPVEAGLTGADFSINQVLIGQHTIKDADADGTLVRAINDQFERTGVRASIKDGFLFLNSPNGRSISIKDSSNGFQVAAGFKGTRTALGYANLFRSINSGEVILNGIALGAASSLSHFISEVNSRSKDTDIGAILEGGRIKLLSLNENADFRVEGRGLDKIGIRARTFKGQPVSANASIVRRGALNISLRYVDLNNRQVDVYVGRFDRKPNHTYNLDDLIDAVNKHSGTSGFTAFIERQKNGRVVLCFNSPERVKQLTNMFFSFQQGDKGSRFTFGYGGVVNAAGPQIASSFNDFGKLSLVSPMRNEAKILSSHFDAHSILGLGKDKSVANLSLKELLNQALSLYQNEAIGAPGGSFAGLGFEKARAIVDVSENMLDALERIQGEVKASLSQLAFTMQRLDSFAFRAENWGKEKNPISELETYSKKITISAFSFGQISDYQNRLLPLLFGDWTQKDKAKNPFPQNLFPSFSKIPTIDAGKSSYSKP